MGSLGERLLTFVQRDLLQGRAIAIETDTYLFDEGLVDSLSILKLIAFVELQIGRQLDDREIVMEHFRTVDAIERRFGPAGESGAG